MRPYFKIRCKIRVGDIEYLSSTHMSWFQTLILGKKKEKFLKLKCWSLPGNQPSMLVLRCACVRSHEMEFIHLSSGSFLSAKSFTFILSSDSCPYIFIAKSWIWISEGITVYRQHSFFHCSLLTENYLISVFK